MIIPDDNLVFTVMLLLPLSVIGEDKRRCTEDIISLVEQKCGSYLCLDLSKCVCNSKVLQIDSSDCLLNPTVLHSCVSITEVPQLIRRRLCALLKTVANHRVFGAKQQLRVPSELLKPDG